jgi:putative phosphoribosyl transferase
MMPGECELTVVPGATHLFEEPGTLERVAVLACDWFIDHLSRVAATANPSHKPRKAVGRTRYQGAALA